MHIDEYEHGRMVIDGRVERRDLILLDGTLHPDWWRARGHHLVLEDLETVLADPPAVLVIGTGSAGRMVPEPGLVDRLAAHGIRTEVLPTSAAVARFNELNDVADERIAAAFHLTC